MNDLVRLAALRYNRDPDSLSEVQRTALRQSILTDVRTRDEGRSGVRVIVSEVGCL